METATPARTVDALAERPSLRGGALCLDFVNSADPSVDAAEIEYLGDYAGLVSWGEYAGAISGEEAVALRRAAAEQPVEAEATRRRAVALRALLARLFVDFATGHDPAGNDLAALNEAVRTTLVHRRLVASADGILWDWEAEPSALDRVLWPVVDSAVDLLTAPELARVRHCDARGCGWLFLDASKNRTRRWCGDVCGSREKARRYYRRRTGRPA